MLRRNLQTGFNSSEVDCRQPIVHFEDQASQVREVRYARNRHQAEHSHETASITLLLWGDLEESTSQGCRQARVCSAIVKPPCVSHANRYGPRGAGTLQITFEPNKFPADLVPDRYSWSFGGPLVRSLFAVWAATRDPRPETSVQSAVCDVLAVARSTEPIQRRGPAPHCLRNVASYLDAHFTSDVSVQQIADEVGLHPVYLARLFRQYFGCSITEYVRRLRIRSVCTALSETSESLAGISATVGFADQSHMTRACQREIGLSPGRMRRMFATPFRTGQV